ncbi:restriction endonuclease [Rhizobium skierniewicense]|uniref:restriction endonuclease n=1 Tax=Rhizobium/Agrobacterium group TaxID=227290 RepID=UPI0013B02AD3|nr:MULTISPECIES: restriction endonuclease [Rhizobium/Agrobacterium group]MCI9865245.1 restriction endonuclease [Rhizobium skierniewicense]NTF07677.1 restriction endonuclease [Agrobacterium rubi]NTF19707.1 restriction endonuclease [Agrobacterium rubi]NTF26672.1 restriction endonuclease [Agrobacterium rubi]UHS56412.1 restriction endonuclease [Agrobacterium vaccinii]
MTKKKPKVRKSGRREKSPDLVKRVAGLKRPELLELWASIEAKKAFDWPPGKAFELCILRAFELEGAEVHWPYLVEIQDSVVEEIDGFVQTERVGFMVESKDLSDAVGIGPVAKLRNQLARRPGGLLGCIFSRSGFTPPAVILSTYCAPQAILLWNGNEIADALKSENMIVALNQKYDWLLRMGLPDWEFLTEENKEHDNVHHN